MIRPILACKNPYELCDVFIAAGWTVDFYEPPENEYPLIGISLWGNPFLLTSTDKRVNEESFPYIGSGVEFYVTVPVEELECIYRQHQDLYPTELSTYPWGDWSFTVSIGPFRFTIAAAE